MHSYKEAEESEHISAVSVLFSAEQCDSSTAESAVTNDGLRRKWLSDKGRCNVVCALYKVVHK